MNATPETLMKIQLNAERTRLTITATRADRDRLKKLGERIHQDKTMHAQLEHVLAANPGLEWIDPSQTGDLTSAPMLGFMRDGGKVSERWAFGPYQVISVLEDLRDKGLAIFTC